MSKSVCKRYRRSIVWSRCYTSKDVSSIHSTTWKCCVPNVGRCTDSSNYLPIDQRGTNLYFLQHHVLLSVFKTDVGGRIFLQLKNATIYLLVCLFVFFGFLFSTTNVCENTDQHRGVCQGSTGAVQMSSHRLPNTDHNMAERRTASRVRHPSCYDWEWRVEHHRSQVLWRGQLRVRSTELCWRDCQQGGLELFWSRR